MIRNFLIALLLVWARAVSAQLSVEACDPGDIYQTRQFRCEVAFNNAGDSAIVVTNLKASAGTDQVEETSFQIPPRSSKQTYVNLDLLGNDGESVHYFSFSTNGEPAAGFEVHGFVNSVLDQYKPTVELGTVNFEDIASSVGELVLSSREAPQFRVTGIVTSPNYLKASVSDDGHKVTVRLKPDVPWGIHHDWVIVELNTPQQRFARFRVDVDVHGSVVPDSNPLALGLIRQGDHNETTIRLVDRGGKPLHIGKPQLVNLSGSVEQVDCTPAVASCLLLRLSISDQQPLGSIKGSVEIGLPQYKQVLRVFVWGLFLKHDAIVRDMNKETQENAAAGVSVAEQPRQELTEMLNRVTGSSKGEVPPGRGPLLKWQVSNEQALHGYVIYRSDSATENFVKINSDTLRVEGEGTSAEYQWRDNTAVSGKTYWYYVGLVYKDGRKKPLTDPQKVVAK